MKKIFVLIIVSMFTLVGCGKPEPKQMSKFEYVRTVLKNVKETENVVKENEKYNYIHCQIKAIDSNYDGKIEWDELDVECWPE